MFKLLSIFMAGVSLAVLNPAARAATVTLLADDATSTTSITGSTNWSNGAVPSGANDYSNAGHLLRTPTSGTPIFKGNSLSVDGGRLLGKFSSSGTLTVTNLILNGGLMDQANKTTDTVTMTLAGGVTVTADSGIGATSAASDNSANFEQLIVNATISGAGGLSTPPSGLADYGVVVLGAANPYSGTFTVSNTVIASSLNRALQLNNINALSSATLNLITPATEVNPVSFASAANTGAFNLGALTGSSSQALTDTAGAAVTLSIGGNNSSSTFSGALTGNGALAKVGNGTLTLSGTNTYSGNTTVSGGALVVMGVVGSSSTLTVGAGATLSGGGSVLRPVIIQSSGTLAPAIGANTSLTISNSLTLNSGSVVRLQLNKAINTNDAILGLTGVSYGGTLVVTNIGGVLAAGDTFTLFQSANFSGSFNSLVLPTLGSQLVWSNRLAIDGSLQVLNSVASPSLVTLLTDDAAGTTSLTGSTNWSNGAVPSGTNDYSTAGHKLLGPTSGSPSFAGNSLTVDAGGSLVGQYSGSGTITVNNLILTGGAVRQAFGSGNKTMTLAGAITVNGSSSLGAFSLNTSQIETLNVAASISGSAALQVPDAADLGANCGLVKLSAANAYSGMLTVSNSSYRGLGHLLQLNHQNAVSNATLNLTATVANPISFVTGIGTFNIGALTGTSSQALADTNSAAVTLIVGGNNSSSTFAGALTDVGALTKVGSGTLTLNGGNTYSGNTTLSAGTLVVNGTIGSGNLTVGAGSTLSGGGTVLGPVIVQSDGTLTPATATNAALTINNSLTLNAGSVVRLQLNNIANTNDAILGLTSVSYGGTLVVTNIGGPLSPGDTFTLFQSAAFSGSFNNLILPALGSQMGWSNRLAIDGTLQVVRTVPFQLLNPGLSSDGFGFDVDGPVYDVYAIQATTDLSKQSNWVTLDWVDTDVLPFHYVDSDAGSYPQRFYRAALGIPLPTNPPPVDVGTNDLGAPPEPRVPLTLTYTLTNPDSGTNVGVWSTSAFVENASWQSASSFTNIQDAMNAAGVKKAWVRFKATSTDATYNNTFFASKHTGLITVWNEGIRNRWNIQGATNWVRYFGFIYRQDTPGTPTQYGVQYAGSASAPAQIDFAFVQMPMKQVAELRNAGSDSTNFQQVLNIPYIRDVCAIQGPDLKYYMVGTPDLHGQTAGIQLFRSDSRSGPFTNMGFVWTFTNATWANITNMSPTSDQIIWAPEISYINNKWYMVYFPNVGPAAYPGFQIGIAAANNPLGPYLDVTNRPIVSGTDPHLFQDDDGSVYMTYGPGYIAKMKPTMDGFAEAPRSIYPHNHWSIANEGTTLFKNNGKYYFSGAFTTRYKYPNGSVKTTYDDVMCVSSNSVYGPYGDRFVAIKNGGNNSFFKDANGKWYCTVWQPNKVVTIVQVENAPDDTWRPATNYDVLPSGIIY